MRELFDLLCNVKISLLDCIILFLVISVIRFIVKVIRNIRIKHTTKEILKAIMLIFSFIVAIAFIFSSIIFFYTTQRMRMLIPAVLGIALLIANIVMYILFFGEAEG